MLNVTFALTLSQRTDPKNCTLTLLFLYIFLILRANIKVCVCFFVLFFSPWWMCAGRNSLAYTWRQVGSFLCLQHGEHTSPTRRWRGVWTGIWVTSTGLQKPSDAKSIGRMYSLHCTALWPNWLGSTAVTRHSHRYKTSVIDKWTTTGLSACISLSFLPSSPPLLLSLGRSYNCDDI